MESSPQPFRLQTDYKHFGKVPVLYIGIAKPQNGKGKDRPTFNVMREYLPILIASMRTKKFSVSFIKKTNGELRHMQSQRHVTKGLNPDARPPNWTEQDKPHLRKVFETLNLTRNVKGQFVAGEVQGQWRTFDMNTVLEVRGVGNIYRIL